MSTPDTQTQIKKLQESVTKLEKVAQLLLNRVRLLEIQNKQQASAINRAHMNAGTADRKITAVVNKLNGS